MLAADLLLPPEVRQELLLLAQRQLLEDRQWVCQSGDPAEALFGVVRGTLRVSVLAPNGAEAVVSVLEPGHWFGDISLFSALPRFNHVQAVGPAEIAVIPASEFHALIARRPDIHMAFTKLLSHRLRVMMAWIDDVILHPLPVRLATRLLAIDHRSQDEPYRSHFVNMSQDDLAASLGVSRQSVNRQLKLWEKDGTLRVHYRRIELLNLKQLMAHAQPCA
ncbi:Crp/Fnr family transcriptional regulator [Ideonella margarita]|uniref:Crp/Fnr family transcriptional regulator n=1 Tax=Ideonella margarita TaxID=2984191 RepID=A0ABU9C7D6_9BURK